MKETDHAPETWARCSLKDIVTINPKNDSSPERPAGFVPMALAPTDYHSTLQHEEKLWGEIKKSYTNFADGDVIFAKVTPCFENGKAAIVRNMPSGIGAGSSEFYVLRPASKEISPRLLFAIIKTQSFMQQGAENMTGAVGLRRVPRAFVESFPVALPSAAEQKVITDKLDTLLAQVENTKARLERIPKILECFRQSVLAAAVSGRLSNEFKNSELEQAIQELAIASRNNVKPRKTIEPTSEHETVLKLFPKSWAVSNFSSLYQFIDYRGKTPKKSESGKRLYTAKNIKMGYVANHPVEYLSDDDYSKWMTRGHSKLGDIFFVTEGHTMGSCALNTLGSDIALAQRTITLQPYGKINTRFHLIYMLTDSFQRLVELNATGSAAKGIKAAKLKGLPIPFPTIAEQTEIVRRVDQLFAHADRIEQQVNNALARVNNLTQSILAKAFRGELTEQWRKNNPELISGENSAEALLEKIKAERAAMKPVKRTRNKRTTV